MNLLKNQKKFSKKLDSEFVKLTLPSLQIFESQTTGIVTVNDSLVKTFGKMNDSEKFFLNTTRS